MKKLILLICILSFQIFISAQSKIELAEKAKTMPEKIKNTSVVPRTNFIPTEDNIIGYTDYDYVGNGGVQNQLSLFDLGKNDTLDAVGVYMERFQVSGNASRNEVLFVGMNSDFTTFQLHDPQSNSGFGSIQTITQGPWKDKAAVMYNRNNIWILSLFDLVDFNNPIYEYELGISVSGPNFCYLDDGTILLIDSDGNLHKIQTSNPESSTQTGISFYNSASINPIKRSFNGQYLAAMAFTENDEVILYTSDNSGETWSEEIIGKNLENEIVNRPNTFPLFTNFAQASYVLDNNGIVHVGMNGYGIHIENEDTTYAYPAIYWNSRNNEWLAVSDPDEEGEDLNGLYPGNGIGNAYPTPMVSKDGLIVSVVYQAPEFVDDNLNVFRDENSTDEYECYYTDIKMTISEDGGFTFYPFYPLPVIGDVGESEVFPIAHDLIIYDGQFPPHGSYDYYGWSFMYMKDAIPGCSILRENSGSENTYWSYMKIGNSVTGVDQEQELINEFALLQNYPNPFNPTTTIQFSIPGSQFATLKVYDILGREVKILVNEVKSPGTYEVKFNGSDLSSGTYFYKITVGNFTQTKKMLLVK